MTVLDNTSQHRSITYAAPVHKVGTRARTILAIRALGAAVVALIVLIPVFWMATTAFKSRADAVAVPPKIFFKPTLEGFVNLLAERSVLTQARRQEMQARRDELSWIQRIALDAGTEIIGVSQYVGRLRNSVIIAGGSTLLA
ncbi:MAG: hypothetical protein FJ026_16610, partial [Chloroflexi bacterium]|nr:hypothetical protein [Chloroflexota bacterium]